MTETTSLYCRNHGRIYKCGAVAPSSDKSFTITLLEYLCNVTTRNFKAPAWTRRILRREISVDGSIITDAQCALTPGCRVSYHRSPWKEPVVDVALEDDLSSSVEDPHTLNILYQDEHLMAVHKPSGLPTMPSQTYFEYSVLNVLRRTSTTLPTFLAPPQPVHRLGVGTSGVLLVATSLDARKGLSCAIREKRVKKIYRALVCGGDTIPDKLRIDCPIGPVPFPIGGGTIHAACPPPVAASALELQNESTCGDEERDAMIPKTKGGTKSALSLVRVVRRNSEANTAVVEVEIPTGRPHQIRIHMAYAGHPLVNDPLYLTGGVPDCRSRLFPKRNKEDEDMDTDADEDEDGDEGEEEEESDVDGGVMRVPLPRDCGYSLHAYQITVEHPTIKGKWSTFTANPPTNLLA